jgi:hypothetical protein
MFEKIRGFFMNILGYFHTTNIEELTGIETNLTSAMKARIELWADMAAGRAPWNRNGAKPCGLLPQISGRLNYFVKREIDIDVKNRVNGVEKIKQIIKDNNLLLPDTAVAKSGSGGFHCYYRNTRETTVDSSDGRKLGIDIRAEKAYIILPPSIHFSGKQYSWYIGNIDSIANANNDVYKLVDIVNELNNKEKQRRENHEFAQVRSPIKF